MGLFLAVEFETQSWTLDTFCVLTIFRDDLNADEHSETISEADYFMTSDVPSEPFDALSFSAFPSVLEFSTLLILQPASEI